MSPMRSVLTHSLSLSLSLVKVDVVAKFRNGQPAGIEATYVMKSSSQWDRFMRFMQRYAEDNNLGFNKS